VKAAFDSFMLTWLADPTFPISEAGRLLELTACESLARR
jgi:hypothetical protein